MWSGIWYGLGIIRRPGRRGVNHNIINELLTKTFFGGSREIVVTDESGAGAESGLFGECGFLSAVAFLVTLLLLKLFS